VDKEISTPVTERKMAEAYLTVTAASEGNKGNNPDN
jgi:hypothetical protein